MYFCISVMAELGWRSVSVWIKYHRCRTLSRMLRAPASDLTHMTLPEQHDMGGHGAEQPAPPPLGSLGDLAAPQPVLLRGLGSFLHDGPSGAAGSLW